MQSKASIIVAITQDSAPVIIKGKGFETRLPTHDGSTSVVVDSLETVTIRPAGGVALSDAEFLERVTAGDAPGDEDGTIRQFVKKLIKRS